VTVIYFIQDSGTLDIKIGYTATCAETRRATFQTGNPSRLVVLRVVQGEKPDEHRLHQRFAAHRVTGEWFRPAPELLLYLLEAGRDLTPTLDAAAGWLRDRAGGSWFHVEQDELFADADGDGVDLFVLSFAGQVLRAGIRIVEEGGESVWVRDDYDAIRHDLDECRFWEWDNRPTWEHEEEAMRQRAAQPALFAPPPPGGAG
jgi:hypothetical protein